MVHLLVFAMVYSASTQTKGILSNVVLIHQPKLYFCNIKIYSEYLFVKIPNIQDVKTETGCIITGNMSPPPDVYDITAIL